MDDIELQWGGTGGGQKLLQLCTRAER
jgi:hypothetical protein